MPVAARRPSRRRRSSRPRGSPPSGARRIAIVHVLEVPLDLPLDAEHARGGRRRRRDPRRGAGAPRGLRRARRDAVSSRARSAGPGDRRGGGAPRRRAHRPRRAADEVARRQPSSAHGRLRAAGTARRACWSWRARRRREARVLRTRVLSLPRDRARDRDRGPDDRRSASGAGSGSSSAPCSSSPGVLPAVPFARAVAKKLPGLQRVLEHALAGLGRLRRDRARRSTSRSASSRSTRSASRPGCCSPSASLFLLVALSYAEGTAALPETGGAATFVRRAFNDPARLHHRLGALPRLPDRDRAGRASSCRTTSGNALGWDAITDEPVGRRLRRRRHRRRGRRSASSAGRASTGSRSRSPRSPSSRSCS